MEAWGEAMIGERIDQAALFYQFSLGRMLRPDLVFDAADAFMATVYLVRFLSAHPGETAAGSVVGYFAQVWRDILADRTFSAIRP